MGKYFGTDGIRGCANKSLDIALVGKVGAFLGAHFKEGKILIGKDTRISSTMFEASLSANILSQGSDAYLLGYCSTPALAYLVQTHDFDCGIMISASHNPYSDNGIKIFGKNGLKIDDAFEAEIEAYLDSGETLAYSDEVGHQYQFKEGIDSYIEWLKYHFPIRNSARILADLANGGACFTAKKLFRALECNCAYINDNPDGYNINNNCGSTHLEMLQERVNEGYSYGFAFDGDADRVLFVDCDGEVIDGDCLLYILAKYAKKKGLLGAGGIVITQMSNIGLKKALEANEIPYEVVGVGDRNVVERMLEKQYLIGGEQSGHIINGQHALFGDGLKTALNIMYILQEENCTLQDLLSDLTLYPQLLKNIEVKDKEHILNDVEINSEIANISEILGSEGRIFVRASGTENLIRVMVEASSAELCQEYVNRVIDLIASKEAAY